MLKDIGSHLFIYIEIMLLCLVIGHVLYALFLPVIYGFFLRNFIKSGLGVFSITFFNALWSTNGQTVIILFIPVIGILIYEKVLRWNSFDSVIPPGSQLIPTLINTLKFLLLPALFFFAWEAFFLFQPGYFHLISPPADYQYYSEISTALSITGQENSFGFKNLLSEVFYGTTPYHYFELWFNNSIQRIFSGNSVISLMLLTFPTLFWLAYIGICATIEAYKPVKAKHLIVAILTLGVGGIFIPIYTEIPYLGSGNTLCVFPLDTYFRKYLIYYPFVLGFWLLFNRNNIRMAFIFLLCLPIVSAGSLPGVVSGSILFLVYAYFRKKYTSKDLIHILVYLLVIVIGYSIFYSFTSNQTIAINKLNEIFIFDNWKNSDTYKTILNIYILTTLQYLLYFAPFLLILWLKKKRIPEMFRAFIKPSPSTAIILIFFFSGLSCWAFLFLTGNARQLFSNSFAVLFICWLIVQIVSSERRFKYMMLVLVLLTGNNFIQAYKHNFSAKIKLVDDSFMKSVIGELNKLDDKVIFGGIIFSQLENNELASRRDKAFHIYPLANYTNFSDKLVDVQNLSVFEAPPLNDPVIEKRFSHLIEITPFYQFVKSQKQNKTFRDTETSKLEFIQSMNLKFIVLGKDVSVPDYLKPLVKKTLNDELSGHTFLLLKS